jgi:glutamate-1-semialdehyde 2,1-aminomutase
MITPEASNRLHARAMAVTPGGVHSPVRSFKAMGLPPLFIRRAEGPWLIDADGRRFIDLIGSWGAAIAGHANPRVVEAVTRAASRGLGFGLSAEPEVRLAETITSRLPWVQRVRLVNSGTEAVMSAARLARAATGRPLLLKFAGCYHGHADPFLISAGSGALTLGTPSSPGVPPAAAAETIVVPFNDPDALDRAFDLHGRHLAAAVVEPIAGNMGLVRPRPGFLERLRSRCDRHGALLIMDEVMTGFRVGPQGAQGLQGVRGDLTTLGKVIGGGLPVGAFGGSAELMALIAPQGPVYQAGTLAGNPVAAAAGMATLELLDPDAYAHLDRVTQRLAKGMTSLAGERHAVDAVPGMLGVFMHSPPVHDLAGASAADHAAFAALFRAMLDRGVLLPPSGYEAMFVSLAHDEAVIDQVLDAFADSLQLIPMNGDHR